MKREREREGWRNIERYNPGLSRDTTSLFRGERERGKKKREERKEADVGRWLLTGREI